MTDTTDQELIELTQRIARLHRTQAIGIPTSDFAIRRCRLSNRRRAANWCTGWISTSSISTWRRSESPSTDDDHRTPCAAIGR